MKKMRNKVLRSYFAESFDGGDPWGSTMAWLFASADFLTDYADGVPAELGFRQSIFGPDEDACEYQALKSLYEDGECSLSAIEHFAKVLNRYAELLNRKGHSY